jgi:hypothetical protein
VWKLYCGIHICQYSRCKWVRDRALASNQDLCGSFTVAFTFLERIIDEREPLQLSPKRHKAFRTHLENQQPTTQGIVDGHTRVSGRLYERQPQFHQLPQLKHSKAPLYDLSHRKFDYKRLVHDYMRESSQPCF